MNPDKPALLSGYIYSIGYNRTCNGSQVWKKGNSTVIIHKDCPAKEAVEAILKGQITIKGTPITWSQRITGHEVRK